MLGTRPGTPDSARRTVPFLFVPRTKRAPRRRRPSHKTKKFSPKNKKNKKTNKAQHKNITKKNKNHKTTFPHPHPHTTLAKPNKPKSFSSTARHRLISNKPP